MNPILARLMPISRCLLAALAACALAGCIGSGPGASQQQGALANVHWPTMDVITTASEPNEARGVIRVAWSGPVFGIESANEQDLARRTIVAGNEAYTSYTGMGWLHRSLDNGVEGSSLSNRLLLWDLRSLANNPALNFLEAVAGPTTFYNASGEIGRGNNALHLDVSIEIADGEVTRARVASENGRESPFNFVPSTAAFGFAVQIPQEVKEPADVAVQDSAANQAEVAVLHLVQDYARTRQGLVPDTVDAQSLRVELVASGKPWPTNPYSGQAVSDGKSHGNFVWVKCSPTDARFYAYGWDSLLFSASLGKGCA